MSEQFSSQRIAWLLRVEALRNRRTWAIGLGTAGLVALAASLLGAWDGAVGDGFYQTFFIAALFVLGTIAASEAFADMHGRATNAAFLLLPASALEKTVVRLLLTTVGVVVCVLALTTVLSWLLEALNALLFGVRRAAFSPADRLAWSLVPHYLVVQSLFFLGAAWFRKLHYVKTVGAVLLIVLALSAVAAALVWLLAETWDDGLRFDTAVAVSLDWLSHAAAIAYYFAVPVFCWYVAWLRVGEAQVSHGI